MRKLLLFLKPPEQWKTVAIIIIGAICGFGIYLSVESKAVAYLSDDPRTCANCHVMTPEYTTWSNSSHRERATCNDCHVPHENPLKKYLFKAKDGLYHAYVFTSRTEPQVIRMHEAGKTVVQSNCIRCHQNQIVGKGLGKSSADLIVHRTDTECWKCHREVPHGRVHSLSSVKYYGKIPPEHQETVPDWLKKYFNQDK